MSTSSIGDAASISTNAVNPAPRQPSKASDAAADSAPVPVDVVHLSSAAQAALAEAAETPAETAKEAQAGDVQAKHLLAKRAAAHAAETSTRHVVA